MSLLLEDFTYNLPLELIAQKPLRPRDHSRLLLLNKESGGLEQKHFFDICNYLQTGDVLVLNNSKVFPARLFGRKKISGGKVEIFLLKKIKRNNWECLLRGNVKEGVEIELTKKLWAKVLVNNQDETWQLEFNLSGDKFWSIINKIGETPLPPYIKRREKDKKDKVNYQTVFANNNKVGSAAAPTAGFHFTKKLLDKVKAKGVDVLEITLHVGLGTFLPIKTGNIKEHKMHSEFIEIKSSVIKKLIKAKKEGRRIVALGTTSCRALESLDWSKIIKDENQDKQITSQSFWTDIFIYPGYKFKIVNALITNFHLPKSTLLILIMALAGEENIKKAYCLAVKEKYRFFSYGDAMFIY